MVTYVQVQSGPEEMDRHLQLTHDHVHRAVVLAPPSAITVHGRPGPVLTEALRANAEAGARVTVVPDRLGGFLRAAAWANPPRQRAGIHGPTCGRHPAGRPVTSGTA